MKEVLALITLFMLLSCEKDDNRDNPNDRQLVTEFAYINPQGKSFVDSILYIPLHGSMLEVNSPFTAYNGARFKSQTLRHDASGKIAPTLQGVFIQWKLRDLATGTVLETATTDELTLQLYEAGQYRLTQYAYAREEDRSQSFQPIDSISKTLHVEDVLRVDSIYVDTLSFGSPYWNGDLDPQMPVDAYVAVYADKSDFDTQKEPMFKTALAQGLRKDSRGVKFTIGANSSIPSSRTSVDGKDKNFIQLNVIQDQKHYTLLDNQWGLIFNNLRSGYLSEDKSKILEEQRLRFGNKTLTLYSSYTFMQ